MARSLEYIRDHWGFYEKLIRQNNKTLSEIVSNIGKGEDVVEAQRATIYTSLPSGTFVGELAYVEEPEGTQWLPGTIGGSYYPKGWYLWNGIAWISDRNAIAESLAKLSSTEVNTEVDYVIPVLTSLSSSIQIKNVSLTNEVTISTSGVATIELEDTFILYPSESIEVYFYQTNDYRIR